MDIIIEKYRDKLASLNELVGELISTAGKDLVPEDIDNHSKFIQSLRDYDYFVNLKDTAESLSTAKEAALYASSIGSRFKNESNLRKSQYLGAKLNDLASNLLDEIKSNPTTPKDTSNLYNSSLTETNIQKEKNKINNDNIKKEEIQSDFTFSTIEITKEIENYRKLISSFKSELSSLKKSISDMSTDNINYQEVLRTDNGKLSKTIEKLESDTSELEEKMDIEGGGKN